MVVVIDMKMVEYHLPSITYKVVNNMLKLIGSFIFSAMAIGLAISVIVALLIIIFTVRIIRRIFKEWDD